MSGDYRAAVEVPDEDWLPCERLLVRFEEAWRQGPRPALDDFLPAESERPWALLVELVHTDLEFRCKAGEAVRVEEYWRRYPELARDRAAAVELIAAEIDLRHGREPSLRVTEYLDRFPDYRAEVLGHWPPAPSSAPDLSSPEGSTFPRPGSAATPVRPEGARLGKYELLEVLGQGSFGVVYRARDAELQRTVAVKVPRPGTLGTAETERFLREARSAAQLHHPHIVTLLEAGRADGGGYLVYEFVPGTTLAEYLAQGRPSFAASAALVAQLAEALDYAHRQGVIHRDIKPSNILLQKSEMQNPKSERVCPPEGSDFGFRI